MEETVLFLAPFLAVVLLVTWLSRRFNLLAPIVLLIVGAAASYLPFVHVPELEPELVLVLLLPPLLYAAAVNTSLVDFRRNIGAIGWLSVGLVIFTAFGVGLVVWAILPVPFAAAVAIGAVVAPPDAVAATAVARSIGLPRRVVSILEGESLVNDATALVSLRSAVAAIGASVTVASVVGDFLRAVLVAVIVGFVVAKIMIWVFRLVKDTMTSTALTFLAPFFAFVPAEELHGSGVIAVVVTGLLLGFKAPLVLTPSARVSLRVNWTTIQYVLENSVFLLIGLQVHTIAAEVGESDLGAGLIIAACAAALVAVVALRMIWVLATNAFVRARGRGRTPMRESLVISWAGMRGVVTLGAALTLPVETPERSVLVLIALVVTVGTLLLQGLTLPALARRLDVHGPDPREDTLQEAAVLQKTVKAGLDAAESVAGTASGPALERMRSQADVRLNGVWERLGRNADETFTPSDEFRRLRMTAIQAERAELVQLRNAGQVEHEVLEQCLFSLDAEEVALQRFEERASLVRVSRLTPHLPDAPCEHLRSTDCFAVPKDHDGCLDCLAEGTVSVHLRLCLTCGNVGCCDSSEGRHATRHYEQTGHPVMRSIEPGEGWRWCFVDEVLSGGTD